jgi:hypothetical protein
VALTSAREPPPSCPSSPTPSDTPTYQDIDTREPTPPVSPASATSTLGENNVDNVPNWEAVDFVEGDFSHVEDDDDEPTFFSQPIHNDRMQIYIDLIYRHPTFFPDLRAEFPDLLEYPSFTTMTWTDWELLHQVCRHQEEQAREVILAQSRREWVDFLEQNGEPVLDHLQAGPSCPQRSLYAESDLLSDYNHDGPSSSSSYHTTFTHLSSHPSVGVTPAASNGGDFEETEVEAPRPATPF